MEENRENLSFGHPRDSNEDLPKRYLQSQRYYLLQMVRESPVKQYSQMLYRSRKESADGQIILCDNWHYSYRQTATSDCKTPQYQPLFHFALSWGPGILDHCTAANIWLLLFWYNNSPLAQFASLLIPVDHTQTHTRQDSSIPVISPSHRPLSTQHPTKTTDDHPCLQRVSNPRPQPSSGCRLTPQTPRPQGSDVLRHSSVLIKNLQLMLSFWSIKRVLCDKLLSIAL